jgi:hypothetical protein
MKTGGPKNQFRESGNTVPGVAAFVVFAVSCGKFRTTKIWFVQIIPPCTNNVVANTNPARQSLALVFVLIACRR